MSTNESLEVGTLKDVSRLLISKKLDFHQSDIVIILNINGTIIPNFSIAKIKNKIITFNKKNDVSKFVYAKSIEARAYWHKYIFPNISIYTTNELDITKASILADAVLNIFSRSLSQRNILKDIENPKLKEFLRLVKSGAIDSLKCVSNHIETLIDVSCFFVSLNDEKFEIESDAYPPPKWFKDLTEANSKKFNANQFKSSFKEAIKNKKIIDIPRNYSINSDYSADRFPQRAFIVPWRSRLDTSVYRESAFVIFKKNSRKNISHDELALIADMIDLFLRRKYQHGQISLLTNLQIEARSLGFSSSQISATEIEKRFKKYLEKFAPLIMATTISHSVQFRIYSAKTNSLEKLAGCQHPVFDEASNIIEKSIRLNNYRQFLSAFTFLVEHNCPYVYIKHVLNIPEYFKGLGLDSTMRCRESTKSEICFPLKTGSIPFATLSLESSVKNAFDDDLNYLQAIAYSIEQFYEQLNRSNDASWLIERLVSQEQLHELKNYAFCLQDTELRDKIISYITEPWTKIYQNQNQNQNYRNISELESALLKIVEVSTGLKNKYSMKGNNEFNIKIQLDKDQAEIAPHVFDACYIILKNLVSNILSHGDIKRDVLTLTNFRQNKVSNSGVILIRLRTHGRLYKDVIEKLCAAPIRTGVNVHYGMFIIGVITRALRGTIALNREPLQESNIIEIRLPMK